MILVGQKEKGYSMMMNCCLGYVLVQMIQFGHRWGDWIMILSETSCQVFP